MYECGPQPQPATERCHYQPTVNKRSYLGQEAPQHRRKFVSALTGCVFSGAYFQIFYVDRWDAYHSEKHCCCPCFETLYSLGELNMFMTISVVMPIRKFTDVGASESFLPLLLPQLWIPSFPMSPGPLLSICPFDSYYISLSMSSYFHQMSNKLT